MPFAIHKRSDGWHVVNKDTGEDKGKSDSLSMAKAHMRALYAHSGEEAKASWIQQVDEAFDEIFFVKGAAKTISKQSESKLVRYILARRDENGEPIFIKAAWSPEAREAAIEARRKKAQEGAAQHDTLANTATDVHKFAAHQASRMAHHATENAYSPEAYQEPHEMHKKAAMEHTRAYLAQNRAGGHKYTAEHESAAKQHIAEAGHDKEAMADLESYHRSAHEAAESRLKKSGFTGNLSSLNEGDFEKARQMRNEVSHHEEMLSAVKNQQAAHGHRQAGYSEGMPRAGHA